MRVGLLVPGSLDTLTGGYLYDRKLAEHLAACGDDLEVMSIPLRSYARQLTDNFGDSVLRRIRDARLDVLVEDELSHPSVLRANRWLRSNVDIPKVTVVHVLRSDEHGRSRWRRLYAAAERAYLSSVDAAVFCCQATRDSAETLLGRPIPGAVVHPACDHLPAGPPAAEVGRRAREPGPLRVLSVANVVPRKGLHLLVDALSRLPRATWRLTVVGSTQMHPRYAQRVRRQVERAGLGANVELLGQLPNAEVGRRLGQAQVLAVPSYHEGLAIAYLEGMRQGLCVVAGTAGGAAEVIGHCREGFLVPPGDVDALAGHLARLAGDRELLASMSCAARERSGCLPGWAPAMEQARQLLQSTVDRFAERRARSAS